MKEKVYALVYDDTMDGMDIRVFKNHNDASAAMRDEYNYILKGYANNDEIRSYITANTAWIYESGTSIEHNWHIIETTIK